MEKEQAESSRQGPWTLFVCNARADKRLYTSQEAETAHLLVRMARVPEFLNTYSNMLSASGCDHNGMHFLLPISGVFQIRKETCPSLSTRKQIL